MADMKVKRLVLGAASTNCYIVYNEGSTEGLVIDPADLGEKIHIEMEKMGLKCVGILLTHGHFDHIKGAKRLQQLSEAKIYAYEEEKEICEDPQKNVSKIFGATYTLTPDCYFKDNEEFDMAGFHVKVLHTPGHTIGGCCYYMAEQNVVFCGDTIFQQSVGRSDFATGSASQLIRSIKDKLLPLPDETVLFPGHGEATTVGDEKVYNPFCQ